MNSSASTSSHKRAKKSSSSSKQHDPSHTNPRQDVSNLQHLSHSDEHHFHDTLNNPDVNPTPSKYI